jgi:hypothetical protein
MLVDSGVTTGPAPPLAGDELPARPAAAVDAQAGAAAGAPAPGTTPPGAAAPGALIPPGIGRQIPEGVADIEMPADIKKPAGKPSTGRRAVEAAEGADGAAPEDKPAPKRGGRKARNSG